MELTIKQALSNIIWKLHRIETDENGHFEDAKIDRNDAVIRQAIEAINKGV